MKIINCDTTSTMSRRDIGLNLSRQKRRKFVVIIDDNPETEMALFFAARRCYQTKGDLLLIYIIEPSSFGHWVNVDKIMEEEKESSARDHLNRAYETAYKFCGIEAETIVLKGEKGKEVIEHIERDSSIAVLVLAAATGSQGAGPLITELIKNYAGTFPVPITIVPGDLSKEEILCLA